MLIFRPLLFEDEAFLFPPLQFESGLMDCVGIKSLNPRTFDPVRDE